MHKILKQTLTASLILCAYASVAQAADTAIVETATKQIKEFLLGDARKVIDLGLLGGGAAASLLRGSWTPVVGGGIAMAVYEILVNVVA